MRCFCDVCGQEIPANAQNYGADRNDYGGEYTARARASHRPLVIAFAIRTLTKEGKDTPADLCAGCLIDAVTGTDARPISDEAKP